MREHAYRIGQIVPSSNTTMETEIPAVLRSREIIDIENEGIEVVDSISLEIPDLYYAQEARIENPRAGLWVAAVRSLVRQQFPST